jgi:hypothetical protein
VAAKELGRFFVGAEKERGCAGLADAVSVRCFVGKCYGSLPVPRGVGSRPSQKDKERHFCNLEDARLPRTWSVEAERSTFKRVESVLDHGYLLESGRGFCGQQENSVLARRSSRPVIVVEELGRERGASVSTGVLDRTLGPVSRG